MLLRFIAVFRLIAFPTGGFVLSLLFSTSYGGGGTQIDGGGLSTASAPLGGGEGGDLFA